MLKRIITLIIYSVCIFTYLQAQNAYRIAVYNGTGNGSDVPTAITADASGNVYVAGSSWGGSSKEDFAVVKYNSHAVQQWIARYNGPGNSTDIPTAIVVDASGNVYITGWCMTTSSAGSEDYCTIKYNSAGVQQWVKLYGPNGTDCIYPDYAYAIGLDAAGNIYVTGTSFLSNEDIATVKYSASGTQLWAARFDGVSHNSDRGRTMYISSSGDVFVGGSSFKDGQGYNAVAIKYNSSGQQQWLVQYNGTGNGDDDAYSIALDNTGNIFICGSTYAASTKLDYLLAKYNSQGVMQWAKFYNGSANDTDIACSIDIDSYNTIYITGSSKGSGTGFDCATLHYNSFGDLFWEQRYNDKYNGIDKAVDVEVTRIANPYSQDVSFACFVTGYSWSGPDQYDYITFSYNSEGSLEWMQKYNSTPSGNDYASCLYSLDNNKFLYVTGTSNTNFVSIWYQKRDLVNPNSVYTPGNIKASPNPFNPRTTFSFKLTSDSYVKLTIYDIQGREVKRIVDGRLSGGLHNYEWDASGYNSGVYFYRLTANGEIYSDKLILIK